MSAATTDPPYTVVVGVSTTSKSPAALTWAAGQARANQGVLVAVRALKRRSPGETSTASPTGRADDTTDPQAALEADVAAVLGSDHGAECRVVYGGKRRTLLAVAESADLLVIDAARNPSASAVLASRIIAAARCPVVVMPPALTREQPTRIAAAGRAAGQAVLRAAGTSGRPGYRPPEQPPS